MNNRKPFTVNRVKRLLDELEAKDSKAEAQQIRRTVFFEEQGIPAHLDADGLDASAFHVLCRASNKVVSTGRLVAIGYNKGFWQESQCIPSTEDMGWESELCRNWSPLLLLKT